MKEHKTFKSFDKVIIRIKYIDADKWGIDLYSHYSNDYHVCIGMRNVEDDDILPYEGNEHLVGTNGKPDEEVILEEGEYIMVADDPSTSQYKWLLRRFAGMYESTERIAACASDDIAFFWEYAIRLSDFNPNDMEETRKHILCVENGRIIRYN